MRIPEETGVLNAIDPCFLYDIKCWCAVSDMQHHSQGADGEVGQAFGAGSE